MPTQRKYLLVAVLLLAAVVVWAGYSLIERTHGPSTHAESAGPAAVQANADQLPGTVVTPHLECEIPAGKNVLWCATFQIAWNELYDLLGGPIQWTGAPEMVSILNKRAVTGRDLDETSYVAMAGHITQDSNDIFAKRSFARWIANSKAPPVQNCCTCWTRYPRGSGSHTHTSSKNCHSSGHSRECGTEG
jgi:hypothetical protein